ncbi:translation initiation factor IF-2 associated domain-containing protein [Niveibacterium microcysteis]|uniref:translation initiation factor IF-2 associated domain-containing protein n=1 Tax=Niveibacterium microcysteis TaxID=2811415 RepID=UPI003CCCA410
MAEMSVAQFASELRMPASVLLEQLQKAGVAKSGENDGVSEADKARLLDYLRRSHGETAPKAKITLTRKQTSEIKASDATGKARTIQVEVRKKRVFVKRDPSELLAEGAQPEGEEALDHHEEDLSTLPEVVAEAAPVAAEPEVQVAPEPEPEPVVEVAPEPEPEPVPEPEPQPEPEPEPVAAPVVEAAVETAPAAEPAPEAAPAAPRSILDMLSPEERAAREREARRASELARIQAEELRLKQAREARKKADEEAARQRAIEAAEKARQPAAPAAAAAAPAGKSGTLHKPVKAEGAKEEKKGPAKKGDREDDSKRRQIKTRGDTGGGAAGWRGARGGGRHARTTVSRTPTSRHRPSRSCAKCMCRKPSRWLTSPTRWQSRRPSSSSR